MSPSFEAGNVPNSSKEERADGRWRASTEGNESRAAPDSVFAEASAFDERSRLSGLDALVRCDGCSESGVDAACG